MRLRRALWRIAGPAAGRLAPKATAAYYRAVTDSLVRALDRVDGVLAVYAHGSYAAQDFRPGRSDVDLVCLIADGTISEELELTQRLRRAYRRRQAVFPADLVTLEHSAFARGAGWLSFMRMRVGSDEAVSPVRSWRLLAGEDVRAGRPWEPDPQLAYVTEAHVEDALAAAPNAVAVTRRLATLAGNLEREGLPASGLRAADPAAAVHAALAVVDEHRATHVLKTERTSLDTRDWTVKPVSEEAFDAAHRLAHGIDLRSATLCLPPFESLLLLLEAPDAEAARIPIQAAVERAAQAADAGIRLAVTTSRLAEDSWRSRFRWIAIASGVHVAGEPLAPRLRFPPPDWLALLLEFRAIAAIVAIRRFALGQRTARRSERVLLHLALAERLLRGAPPSTLASELVPHSASLSDREWVSRALELWRDVRSLVRQNDALGPHPVAVD